MVPTSARVGSVVARSIPIVRDLLRPRTVTRLTARWVGARLARNAYRELTEAELLATRTSDTAFVFGSGRSLLDIPFYAETIYIVQREWRAEDSNELVARRLLPESARVFPYHRKSRGSYSPPSRSFAEGLVHGWNSSISVTNFAILMGFRRIVLTGIDLYDKEYFWLEKGERRDALRPSETPDRPFPMADEVIDVFARWRAALEPEGVELLVYNPRSRLARALEVFRPES